MCGGPPCVDYSTVNAYRKGTEGKQGKYLKKFGKFIRKLGKHQQDQFQKENGVLFIAENVILRGDDLKKVRKAFGIKFDPIEMDALYVSP